MTSILIVPNSAQIRSLTIVQEFEIQKDLKTELKCVYENGIVTDNSLISRSIGSEHT